MLVATKSKARQRQGELGQFFTAAPVAEFMASLFGPLPEVVRLLDAGAGAGALTSAFVSRLCNRADGVLAVEATLYEIDPLIQDALLESIKDCERACAEAGIRFSFAIHATDFIDEMSRRLSGDLFGTAAQAFDVAISNPPYRKINIDSPERLALRSLGIETSNVYAGFIALMQRLLVPGGQLVAITPRSFCNGPYFRPFREELLDNLELHRLHVFESRQAAFRADSVLQENIIFHAVKGRAQPSEMVISSSSGEKGDPVTQSALSFGEVVHSDDSERFIHIPVARSHAVAKVAMEGLSSSLAQLGLSVSTGRVVDFRLRHALRREPGKGTVPLIYPCHLDRGTIRWPRLDGRKPNAILDNEETRPWLVPSGVYLVVKRFTSKEERRRVVACIFEPNEVNAMWLGFENHLNYFHSSGRGLDRGLAAGLFVFLNSTMVDQYFRRFSGHTQVNAADLRSLPFPNREMLEAMGAEIGTLDLTQDAIDERVTNCLNGSR